MIVADLHVHTRNSDGELSLSDVPAAARAAGVDVVAVTDHDRPHPDLDAPVERRDGVTVIHGVELRVEAEHGRVDLLGYGLEPTTALRREVERLQADRVARAERMLDLVEAEVGVRLDVELHAGVGRPHLARALAERPHLDYDVDRAFAELLGAGRPCYVPRDVPSFERGRALLAESAELVGLAHPLRYEDPEGALALTRDLDAVELYYPYDRPVGADVQDGAGSTDDAANEGGSGSDGATDDGAAAEAAGDAGAADPDGLVAAAVERHDLLATGGSDAHGRELGRAGLDDAAFAPVRDALELDRVGRAR